MARLSSLLAPSRDMLQDLPLCQNVELSTELLDFFAQHVERRVFFPGDLIEPDGAQSFLPKNLLTPALNITYAIAPRSAERDEIDQNRRGALNLEDWDDLRAILI